MLPLECCRNIAATCGMLCKVRNIAATFLQHSTVTGLKRIELRASRFQTDAFPGYRVAISASGNAAETIR
ncbi:hypothetical protein PV325_009569 [Microctonus aethiopoides]|nr:hypothetical protein PV325_009569 [Microctonus aethiopoides]